MSFKRVLVRGGVCALTLLAAVGATATPSAQALARGQAVPATPANNAVARVLPDDGKLCSGTLVSPRIVLTAGHCIKHPEPDPPLHAPNWQQNPDKLNHEDWEQPGRFYELIGHPRGIEIRFGPNANSPVATRIAREYAIFTSTDSALLRFTTPVGIGQAVPVPVLTRTPGTTNAFWNSKTVTLMGYAASTMNTQGAFKTYSNATSCLADLPNYMCANPSGDWAMVPGDSGGPWFWNDAAAQRWLVATNGIGGEGPAFGVRTSHRGEEIHNAIFPDQQKYFDRILGAADIAFAQVTASGGLVANSVQVAQGREATVAHPSVGRYNVSLPKVAGTNTVIATAHRDSKAFCQARSETSSLNVVECFSHTTGARVDTGFSILSTSRWADVHALINASGTSPVVTSGRSPGSTQKPTVNRSALGRYGVGFPGIVGTLGNVLVTATQGSGKAVKCSVISWTSASATVGCTDAGGNPVDHSFAVLGARKDALEKRSDMFAWANNPTAAQYVVSASYSQMNDGTPVADRLGVGSYKIRFNGAQNTFNGVFQVTPYGRPDVSCGVLAGTFTAEIKCLGLKGQPVDVQYVVRYLKPQN